MSRASAIMARSTRIARWRSENGSPPRSSRNGCASAATGIRAAASRSTCSGRPANCPKTCGFRIRASPPTAGAASSLPIRAEQVSLGDLPLGSVVLPGALRHRAHLADKAVDFAGQRGRLFRQVGSGFQHAGGGAAGFVRSRADAGDIAGNGRCRLRRVLHGACDLSGRLVLLIHGGRDDAGWMLETSSMVLTMPSIAETVFCVASWIWVIWLLISSVALAVCEAKFFTSLATTAKPLPDSPARAASMVALSANRLV